MPSLPLFVWGSGTPEVVAALGSMPGAVPAPMPGRLMAVARREFWPRSHPVDRAGEVSGVRGIETVLFLVVLGAVVAAFAGRLRVPAPALLVIAGLAVGLPGVPRSGWHLMWSFLSCCRRC